MSRRLQDISGQTFNMLTVLKPTRVSEHGQSYWLCRCECGTEKEVRRSHLVDGGVKSCGCAMRRLMAKSKTTHGHWAGGKGTPEYSAWMLARVRCHVPSNHAFPRYGARGIVMCDRWRFGEDGKSGFECFIADMGLRPTGGTLDRTDNDGPYSPDNCRWVSQKVQTRNRGNNRYIVVDGERMCASEAAEKYGLRAGLVQQRLIRGWDAVRAVKEPPNR